MTIETDTTTAESIASEAEQAIEEVLANTSTGQAEAAQEDVPEPKTAKTGLDSGLAKQRAVERQRDREAGRTSVLDALNKRATSLGFANLDEMLKGQPKTAPAAAKPNAPQGAPAGYQEELKTRDNTIRGLRSRISALETELELRHVAYNADINGEDIEYAVHQVQQHYRKLEGNDAKSFDPATYFTKELRSKKPGIFRAALEAKREVAEEPVSTSPVNGKAPRAASSTSVQQSAAQVEQPKRATEMPRAEYLEMLRKRGIRNPATMV